MAPKTTLRFLLALGGQRIVVLNQQSKTRLYAEQMPARENISPARLYTAVQAK